MEGHGGCGSVLCTSDGAPCRTGTINDEAAILGGDELDASGKNVPTKAATTMTLLQHCTGTINIEIFFTEGCELSARRTRASTQAEWVALVLALNLLRKSILYAIPFGWQNYQWMTFLLCKSFVWRRRKLYYELGDP